MNKLNVSYEGIYDKTGYLHSFAKAVLAASRLSPWKLESECIIATSGFAFFMWVETGLCPSSTSVWGWDNQKPWVETSGLLCEYVGRYWDEGDQEEAKRLKAISLIKASIERGIPAIVWDLGDAQWGLATGFDDEAETLATLNSSGIKGEMPYKALGNGSVPILSVLAISGHSGKDPEDVLKGAIKLASAHLEGDKWCGDPENLKPYIKGLEAYDILLSHFEGQIDPSLSWNMEYLLGTYGALKHYAWEYFSKAGLIELADLYEGVYKNWESAFQIKASEGVLSPESASEIASLLRSSKESEKLALELMNAAVLL